jgi:teichuronic acid biosynthesis glycosyltransferase TuaC
MRSNDATRARCRPALRVLMITPEYPRPESPGSGSFILRQTEALRATGVEVDELRFSSRGNLINHVRAWRRMRRMLARVRYDVVHAQFGHVAPLALLQNCAPVLVTFRGEDLLGIPDEHGRPTAKGALYVALSRTVAELADAVVVVSRELGARLPRTDWQLIPSGVDLELFRPQARDEARRRLGWPLDRPIALFAALDPCDPRKRRGLAEAAIALAAPSTGLELRVASGVPPTVMPFYMNASDLLLLTSVNEGSPNVVKEAMACNLPVVSVNVGDVGERLRDVQPSAVCAATPRALAAGVELVLADGRRSNGRASLTDVAEPLLAEKLRSLVETLSMRKPRDRLAIVLRSRAGER